MEILLASFSASISELKQNPNAILEKAGGESVVILNNNRPAAYLVPVKLYKRLLERLEDYELGECVRTRQYEKKFAVKVLIDDVVAKRS